MSDNEQHLVAVKIIDKNKLQMQNDKEKINRELEHINVKLTILRYPFYIKVLDSEHIVKMFDIAQTPNNLYIFLEYCNGGSLDQYLQKYNG
jgi:serine/threonine protein kinase